LDTWSKLLLFFGLARKMFSNLTYSSLMFVVASYVMTTGTSCLAVERGKEMFDLCVACHGTEAQGNQKLGAPAIAGMPAWYVVAQLTKFRSGARGNHPGDSAGLRMRPMAQSLPFDSDLPLIADFVSKLPVTTPPQVVTGSVVRGEELFKICVTCHAADGKGNEALFAPPLISTSDWYLLTQLKNFKAGIRGGNATLDPSGAMMKGMAATLDDQGMLDVVYYIQTLK
jgi:cytochrome c553